MSEAYIANDNPLIIVTTMPTYTFVAQDSARFTAANLIPGQTSETNPYGRVTATETLEAIESVLREEVTVLRIVANAFLDL